MLNWLFEIFAPSTFTKGIYKYDKGDYRSAAQLLKKAAKWMPSLQNDSIFKAYILLVNYQLEHQISVEDVKAALQELEKSELKSYKSYKNAETELKNLLKE